MRNKTSKTNSPGKSFILIHVRYITEIAYFCTLLLRHKISSTENDS